MKERDRFGKKYLLCFDRLTNVRRSIGSIENEDQRDRNPWEIIWMLVLERNALKVITWRNSSWEIFESVRRLISSKRTWILDDWEIFFNKDDEKEEHDEVSVEDKDRTSLVEWHWSWWIFIRCWWIELTDSLVTCLDESFNCCILVAFFIPDDAEGGSTPIEETLKRKTNELKY